MAFPLAKKKEAPVLPTLTMREALTAAEAHFRSKGLKDIIFDPARRVEFVPTGCMVADLVLGGGWARGRLAEVFGQEQSCKTSLILSTCAQLQREGKVSVLVDLEHSFNVEWSRAAFGLEHDMETFCVLQPNNIDEADAIHMRFVESLKRIDFLAFDSVDTMRPKAQIEGSLSDERRIGAHAQAMGRFVAKLNPFVHHRKIPAVFVNQMRHIIPQAMSVDQPVGTGAGFNLKETYTTTGGQALRYYARQRLKLEFGGRLYDEMGVDPITGAQGKQRIGQLVHCINVKNTVARPLIKFTGRFYTSRGPGRTPGWANDRDLLEIMRARGRVAQTSGQLSYTGLHTATKIRGAKESCELEFLANNELVADARDLLRLLMSGDKAGEMMPAAQPGQDYAEHDLDEMSPSEIADLERETGVEPTTFDEDDAEDVEPAIKLKM